MTLQQSVSVSLRFGQSGHFQCSLDSDRVVLLRQGPHHCGDVSLAARQALQSPLDFPTLDQAVLSDDRIAIALDRQTPGAAAIIAEIWRVLASRHVQPENVTILQPAALNKKPEPDPRTLLPEGVRDAVVWKIHDPTDEQNCALLASTSTGESVHLARELVDAGLVITVGMTAFDPILGYCGTSSVLYPGMSTVDAIKRSLGLGHRELLPQDERPLRQLMDEIGWLIGIQFTVQVTPASTRDPHQIVAGNSDSVLQVCRAQVNHNWLISLPDRVHTVLVTITDDVAGHGWNQLGAALACAEQLVEQGGRIIVLSELKEAPQEGINLLRQFENPDECPKPLRQAMPIDLIPASQLVAAARRARVMLYSQLATDLVDELFMLPIDNLKDVERLLSQAPTCALVGSAQHAFGLVD